MTSDRPGQPTRETRRGGAPALARPVLEVDGLVVEFQTDTGPVQALRAVSFEVMPGEVVALVGESGSGKSTTALAAMKLLGEPSGRIVGGRVTVAGRDIAALSDREMRLLRGEHVAMVFQDPLTSLNPVLTIGEQLMETLEAHGVQRLAAKARAVELLGLVGIPDQRGRMSSYPHELSGGMRQRVVIAMALALKPRLLIADEPTTALDVTIQAQVLELLRALVRTSGTSLLYITHDLGVVAGMADRVLVMYAGRVVESATVDELFHRPAHPYTAALIGATPRLDTGPGLLQPIEGAAASAASRPAGCPFAPRCPYRQSRCVEEEPPLLALEPRWNGRGPAAEQGAACWYPLAGSPAEAGLP